MLLLRQELYNKRVEELTDDLRDEAITLAIWMKGMKREIKQMHVTAAAIGMGDWQEMTQSDWGLIGRKVRDQYAYLNGFVQDVAANDGSPWSTRNLVRALMYGGAAREGFEIMMADREATMYKWTLGVAEHCPDCIALAAQGWVPRGTHDPAVPGSGHTVCLTNCDCHLEYE